MKSTKRKLKAIRSVSANSMCRLKRNMLACLTNKSKIANVSSLPVSVVLRSSWTIWLETLSRSSTRDSVKRTMLSPDMRWTENSEWEKRISVAKKERGRKRKRCVSYWTGKWWRRKLVRMLQRLTMTSKLNCGLAISRIMKLRSRDWQTKSSQLMLRTLTSWSSRFTRRNRSRLKRKWTVRSFSWTSLFCARFRRRVRVQKSMVHPDKVSDIYKIICFCLFTNSKPRFSFMSI